MKSKSFLLVLFVFAMPFLGVVSLCALEDPLHINGTTIRPSTVSPRDKQKVEQLINSLTLQSVDGGTVIISDKKPKPKTQTDIVPEEILDLEKKLDRRIIAQQGATKAVKIAILNFCAGLKDPKTPIGVFLFLGPSGVGKTELAKALAEELYKSQDHLIRFDMSHFTEPHSLSRLIGSPPGYINHEEGGQLTEALKRTIHPVVLLDEIEKADPQVHKIFLPAFDEGYLTDSKDQKVGCSDAIFIMTSNICSQQIIDLFNKGFTQEEILATIEPLIIAHLSPELYNRMQPIIFQPLPEEAMREIVEIFMKRLIQKIQAARQIDLEIEDSAKEYLAINGYHPTLGARPLKQLIQSEVVAAIAYTLIKEKVPNGSHISLAYSSEEHAWHLTWSRR